MATSCFVWRSKLLYPSFSIILIHSNLCLLFFLLIYVNMKCFVAALATFIHMLIGTAFAQSPRATDLFHIRNSGEPGGCTVSQIALIEIWLEEVHLLHAAARNGFFNGAGHFGNAMHTSWILGITWNGRDMAPKSTELWEKLKGTFSTFSFGVSWVVY